MAASRYPMLEAGRESAKQMGKDCHIMNGCWKQFQKSCPWDDGSKKVKAKTATQKPVIPNPTGVLRMLVMGPAKIGFLEGKSLSWVVSLRSIESVEVVKTRQRNTPLAAEVVKTRRRKHPLLQKSVGMKAKRASRRSKTKDKTPRAFWRMKGQKERSWTMRHITSSFNRRPTIIVKRDEDRKKQQTRKTKRKTFSKYSIFLRITTKRPTNIFQSITSKSSDESNSKSMVVKPEVDNIFVAEVCNEATALLMFDFLSQVIFMDRL